MIFSFLLIDLIGLAKHNNLAILNDDLEDTITLILFFFANSFCSLVNFLFLTKIIILTFLFKA